MGLMDRLRGELIDIVEWTDTSRDTLAWKFPRHQNEIKSGAKLVVREGQAAVFVDQGRLADVFDPGTYTLDGSNLTMIYSVGLPFPLTSVALTPAGGDNYTASIPAGACDDEVVFNFIIGVLDGDDVYSPADPLQFYSGSVVCESDDCLADANGDGVLSPADFSAWVAAFNAMAPECDQNADGVCSPADFSAWVANYNAGCP